MLCALVYATRALAQALFYLGDQPGLLAAGKLLLGWPPTFLAVAGTLASQARRGRRQQRPARVRDARHHVRAGAEGARAVRHCRHLPIVGQFLCLTAQLSRAA